MTRQSQKDEERVFLVKALGKIGLKYEIASGVRERPDFVITCENKTIGVEITSLPRTLSPGENAKKLEASISHIKNKSIEIYSNLGGPPIIAQIVLDGTKPIINKKSFTEILANHLFLACTTNHQRDLPSDVGCISFQNKNLSPITEIIITPSPTNESGMFVISKFNSTEVCAADVNDVVANKSLDTSEYPSFLSEKWLIIVLPLMAMAGDSVLPNNICTPEKHGFNRIYLFDSYRDKLAVVGTGNIKERA